MMRSERRRGSGLGTADNRASVYGCFGDANSCSGRRGLHDPADIHHRDPLADVLDDAQVVRDEEVGQAEPFLELEQEVEYLRLDRHIERGNRLVRNDQARIQRKCAGDADPLPLAAREGMRVAPHVFRSQADQAQDLDDPVGSLLRVAHAVHEQRLADDVQQGSCAGSAKRTDPGRSSASGAEGRADCSFGSGCHVQDFTVVRQQNLAGRRLDGSQDAAGSRRLSAAALADERQRFASLHEES